MQPHSKKSTSLSTYLWHHIKRYPFTMVIFVLTLVVDAVVPTWLSYLTKQIVDKAQQPTTPTIFTEILYIILYSMALMTLLEVVWRFYGHFKQVMAVPKMRRNIIKENVEKLLQKSYAFFQNNPPGDLTHTSIRLSNTLPTILQTTFNLLSTLVLVLSSLYLLFQVSIGFCFLLLFWVISMVLLVLLFHKRIAQHTEFFSAKEMEVYGKSADIFSGILSVKLFNRNRHERKLLDHTLQETLQAERKMNVNYWNLYFCCSIIFVLFQGGSLFLLLKLRQIGSVNGGDFALVLSLNNTITYITWMRIRSFTEFGKLIGESKQALGVLNSGKGTFQVVGTQPLQVQAGKITCQNINFQYEGTQQAVFENFSLTIAPKEKVGIVGKSGGGKSTLIQLLLRLHPLTKGIIAIDGQDIAQAQEEDLRNAISLVPQNPILFHRDIQSNIQYGNLKATEEQVITAAKKAQAHDFIQNTEKQYLTNVGEGGSKLSGGQRQRIAMARAILKDAPILILDEATSQLDALTEADMQKSLDFLMEGKTTLVVAHRLSTLVKMDRIIVIDQGRILEEGTHEALLQKEGAYHRLWHTQVNGFLGDEAI